MDLAFLPMPQCHCAFCEIVFLLMLRTSYIIVQHTLSRIIHYCAAYIINLDQRSVQFRRIQISPDVNWREFSARVTNGDDSR